MHSLIRTMSRPAADDHGIGVQSRVRLIKAVHIDTSQEIIRESSLAGARVLVAEGGLEVGPSSTCLAIDPQNGATYGRACVRCLVALTHGLDCCCSFFVGRTDGTIRHGSRHGEQVHPSTFTAVEALADEDSLTSAVTCVHVSRILPQFFLAGYANGDIW